jgi:hypothetical protein
MAVAGMAVGMSASLVACHSPPRTKFLATATASTSMPCVWLCGCLVAVLWPRVAISHHIDIVLWHGLHDNSPVSNLLVLHRLSSKKTPYSALPHGLRQGQFPHLKGALQIFPGSSTTTAFLLLDNPMIFPTPVGPFARPGCRSLSCFKVPPGTSIGFDRLFTAGWCCVICLDVHIQTEPVYRLEIRASIDVVFEHMAMATISSPSSIQLPRTYKEAMRTQQAPDWKEVTYIELDKMNENQVYEVVDHPQGQKPFQHDLSSRQRWDPITPSRNPK